MIKKIPDCLYQIKAIIMNSQENFESKVAELIHRLPPMPGNIEHLLLAAKNPQEDDDVLLGFVKQDPGLCADILHLANTFSSRPQGHDDTIDEAVGSVGIKPLIQLVGVWYAKEIIQEEFSAPQHLDEYFRHSREISLACRILSEVTNLPEHDCEVSSLAGLIHDMGRLVIMIASNRLTAPLMGTQWSMMKSIVNDERKLLGMDHCQIGMQICKKWNYSPLLQESMLRHHCPLIDDDFNLLGAIIFTSHFVACSDFTGEMLSSMLPVELLENLNLTLTDFKKAQEEYSSRMGNIR